MAALVDQVQATIEQHGTPLQLIEFYQVLSRVAFRRDTFHISDETLGHLRTALAMAQNLGDPTKTTETLFSYGFAMLWHGDVEPAILTLQSAFESAERIGNSLLKTQALAYWTIAERRRGCLEQARTLVGPGLAAAQSVQRDDYIGVALGNQAWLAWRDGKPDEARTLGLAALTHLNQLAMTYPFHWIVLLPLIAARVAQAEIEPALGYARTLLEPGQLRLPTPVTTALQDAIRAWEEGQPEAAKLHLEQVIAHAQAARYL